MQKKNLLFSLWKFSTAGNTSSVFNRGHLHYMIWDWFLSKPLKFFLKLRHSIFCKYDASCTFQAPDSLKTVVQSVWLLTVSIGDLVVIIVANIQAIPSQVMLLASPSCLISLFDIFGETTYPLKLLFLWYIFGHLLSVISLDFFMHLLFCSVFQMPDWLPLDCSAEQSNDSQSGIWRKFGNV